MNPKTITKLQYFVEKVCSVFTGPINRSFDEVRSREHFVVRVKEIDVDGLWGTHPYNNTISFFPLSEIKLITEEIVLDPTNPEHAKMLQQYQEKTGKPIMSDVSPHMAPVLKPPPAQLVNITGLKPTENKTKAAPEKMEPAFVDVKSLSSLAKQAKRSFDITDMLN